jgi:hypothetical protein
MPVAAARPPQPGIPAALGPRPAGGSTMSPISAGSGASDQEKVNMCLLCMTKLGQQQYT